METLKFRIPMFGIRQNLEFPCLENPKIKNSKDWNGQTAYVQCLEMPKLRIAVFGKAKNKEF